MTDEKHHDHNHIDGQEYELQALVNQWADVCLLDRDVVKL